MRQVLRDRPAPPALTAIGKDGLTEAQRAHAHFTSHATKATPFKFTAYRAKPVQRLLKEIFSLKCGYCESRFAATGPPAIDHYRPKSRYWWLASDWHNLIPSCTYCNSLNTHVWPDGTEMTLGKGDQFPLAPGSRRASRPGAEARETPLLLNPCRDDPAAVLRFDPDGVVRPVVDRAGVEDARARASIDTYGLYRRDLVLERGGYASRVLGQLGRIEEAEKPYIKRPGPKRLEKLDREIRELATLLSDGQPYVTMARQLAASRLSPFAKGRLALGSTGGRRSAR